MHSFRSKTKILGIFTPLRCSKTSIWVRTTSFMSKTRVLGGFTPFHCRTCPIVKIGIVVHLMHEFMPLDLFLVFCSKHAQSTTLVLKLMFWMVSCYFVAPPDPLKKFVSGGI